MFHYAFKARVGLRNCFEVPTVIRYSKICTLGLCKSVLVLVYRSLVFHYAFKARVGLQNCFEVLFL